MSTVLKDFFSAVWSVPALFRRSGAGGGQMVSASADMSETCTSPIRENRFETGALTIGHQDNGFGRKGKSAVAVMASASEHIGLDALFGLENAQGAKAGMGLTTCGAAIVMTDFDPEEDVLVVETQEDDEVCVLSQTVVAQGVLVAFDNGSNVLLQGLRQEIPTASIIFVAPDSEGNAGSNATLDRSPKICAGPLVGPMEHGPNAPEPSDFGATDGFAPKDIRSTPRADFARLAPPPSRSSKTSTLHGPIIPDGAVIPEQKTTADGVFFILVTGHAAWPPVLDAAISPAYIAVQSPEMAASS